MEIIKPRAEAGLFTGQVALITGASHGIGAAAARLLASLGAAVAVNYHHDGAAAAAVVADIRAGGGHAAAIRADVTDTDDVARLAAGVTAALGPPGVLILNAAGIGQPARAPFLQMPPMPWSRRCWRSCGRYCCPPGRSAPP